MTNEERFREVFAENVRRRSRTAKGQDKGKQTSSSKRMLLLSGDALAARTAENVARLIDDVWAVRLGLEEGRLPNATQEWLLPHELRSMCERWYDIASDGLVDHDGYEPEFLELEKRSARVDRFYRLPHEVNRRYRLWTPGYTTLQVPPILLEPTMDRFYAELAAMIRTHVAARFPSLGADDPDGRRLARTYAYADVMMDGEVHPWLDGCSRVSTALVMWIAASFGATPPLFAETKAAHYETIRDIDAHEEYFLSCIRRSNDARA